MRLAGKNSNKLLRIMLKKITIVLALFVCHVCQSASITQKPNYTGTWILNLDKSILESRPEGLTSSIFIIKQEGDEFKLSRYHIFGEKKKKISFTMTSDGKTRSLKLLFNGKLEWKEDTLVASIWRKNFENIVNYRFGDSQDEFIADEVYTGNPKSHHNLWVFDRNKTK
jgi:hypothetical protein